MVAVEHSLLVLQLISLLAETACFCWCLVELFFLRQTLGLVWFVVCTSILCFTFIVTQILSLKWTPKVITRGKFGFLVILHLLFLGLPTRYLVAGYSRLKRSQCYENLFQHTGLLRLVHTSMTTVPLTMCVFYVFWASGRSNWILFSSSIVGVFSGAISICVLRRPFTKVNVTFKDRVNCAAIILCFIWRFGELASRILVLALFASLFTYWVLIVIGLHWFTILAWAAIVTYTRKQKCSLEHVFHLCAISYINTFAFLDSTKFRPKYGNLLYYLIMSVENATLVIVCLIETWDQTLNVLLAMVATGAYLASLIAAGIHRLCIKTEVSKPSETVIPLSGTNNQNPKNMYSAPPTKANHHKRPLHPPKYSEIQSSSAASMETLNTQLTRASFAENGVPNLITEPHPGVSLADSHIYSVSDPDLSLKRKREGKRRATHLDNEDVLRLFMRESGSPAIADSDPNLSTMSYNTHQQHHPVRSASVAANKSHMKKHKRAVSESESEYAWDNYDFYDPKVPLDPRLLDTHIASEPEGVTVHKEKIEAPQSCPDSDYGTLNQWVDHTKHVTRAHKHKKLQRKKRPTIVCGTGFHKEQQGKKIKDDTAWKSETDISYISRSTKITDLQSAASDYMSMESRYTQDRIDNKVNEDMSEASVQTHHSDPVSNAGTLPSSHKRATPCSSFPTDSISGSHPATAKPLASSQDDIFSLYSADLSSHATTDDMKAAISEKYRIKSRLNRRTDHHRVASPAKHTKTKNTKKLHSKKQFEAEIDSIVCAIQSEKKTKSKLRNDAVHVCQKSFTSDYGSLHEPELNTTAWYDGLPETET